MKAVQRHLITAIVLGSIIALAPISRAQQSRDNASDRPAAGQRERRGGQAGAAAFERIATQLKLTAEQKSKLQPIYQEENTKLRELRRDTALTPDERRTKTREIREQFLAKMKPILTTEQFEQLKKLRESPAERGQRGQRAGQGQNRNRSNNPNP